MSLTIDLRLPCHAVTTNQRLFSAASGGWSLAVTVTCLVLPSFGAGASGRVAFGGLPFGIGMAHAITATAATAAAGTTQRGRLSSTGTSLTERPIQPPITP